ncbi:MAG: hypothetical protein LBR71_00780 [Synergistaceae bacterium]|jgi:hypothetical protein|nr:hypothetical protein [Synergistaceae bacterium]
MGATAFQRMRREQEAERQRKLREQAAEQAAQELKSPDEEVKQAPGLDEAAKEEFHSLSESQLKAMNKDELVAYAAGLDLELQPEMKKDQMIEAVLTHAANKN